MRSFAKLYWITATMSKVIRRWWVREEKGNENDLYVERKLTCRRRREM
jgi:hypothetical protein